MIVRAIGVRAMVVGPMTARAIQLTYKPSVGL